MGVESALALFARQGFEALDLTVCYHPIVQFTPGLVGRRLMRLTEGAVLFPARRELYGRIAPLLHPEAEILNAWPRAAAAAQRHGLALNGWTVTLFQPWIAARYPDTARVLPTGQANPLGVCPGSSDVREFLAALVADLATQFPLSTVQLEGITYPYFETGWPLPRMLITVGPWTRRLLSLCFCGNCCELARSRGVSVDPLRRRVVAEIDRVENSRADTDSEIRMHQLWTERDPDYARFVQMREDVCVELVREVSAGLASVSSGTRVAVWGPQDFDRTPVPIERLLGTVDTLQTYHGKRWPENALRARTIADAHPGMRVATVHWCGGSVGPEFGPEFERTLGAAAALPADELKLFNWAMLKPEVAAAVVPLVRRAENAADAA
jgi:hypothetical protein